MRAPVNGGILAKSREKKIDDDNVESVYSESRLLSYDQHRRLERRCVEVDQQPKSVVSYEAIVEDYLRDLTTYYRCWAGVAVYYA
jgi:hypothetical protein